MAHNFDSKQALINHLKKIARKTEKMHNKLMEEFVWSDCVGSDLSPEVADIYTKMCILKRKIEETVAIASLEA